MLPNYFDKHLTLVVAMACSRNDYLLIGSLQVTLPTIVHAYYNSNDKSIWPLNFKLVGTQQWQNSVGAKPL